MRRPEARPALAGTRGASPPPPVSTPAFFPELRGMGSGRTLKFALCEVLQFAGLCAPLFVVMQRFAGIAAKVKASARPHGDGATAYWLIVASSIAYVTSTALLVWVPMKYMVFVKNKFLDGRRKWRPVALVYVILSTLPCFAFLVASSKVQLNNNMKHDAFTELPVSLVLFSLICVDLVERIRHCRLTGQANDGERDAHIPSSVLTHVEQVTPVAPAVPGQPGPAPQHNDGNPSGADGTAGDPGGPPSVSGLSSRSASTAAGRSSQCAHGSPPRSLCACDPRADVFVDSFMFWMDTVEMVRVAGLPGVYYSGWVFPVYIFSFLSCLRVVAMPQSPLLSSLGVALQDFPFFFVRVALVAFFGFVTPVLYLMKNLLVCLAFVYFNFMTRLRVFNTERMFF
ncbi:transmembrane protein 236 [Gasterosteus aculeatus]